MNANESMIWKAICEVLEANPNNTTKSTLIVSARMFFYRHLSDYGRNIKYIGNLFNKDRNTVRHALEVYETRLFTKDALFMKRKKKVDAVLQEIEYIEIASEFGCG